VPLSLYPVSHDTSHARQARYFSEFMLWKCHNQGPWNLWLSDYLAQGHPINIWDFNGKTPVHHALITEYEREDKVRALVDVGADVEMRDFEDQTPVDVVNGVDKALFIFLLRTWQRSQRSNPLVSSSWCMLFLWPQSNFWLS
jgi:hypothetical protein